MTLERYDEMMVEQDGKCAVCREPPGLKSLAVDHCHGTGKVRALLCGRCNTSIGLMRESPELLRALAIYVESKS